ncbi:MAG: DNA-binding domain of ModE, partial [uncultured Acetobacteraceae bacterium]
VRLSIRHPARGARPGNVARAGQGRPAGGRRGDRLHRGGEPAHGHELQARLVPDRHPQRLFPRAARAVEQRRVRWRGRGADRHRPGGAGPLPSPATERRNGGRGRSARAGDPRGPRTAL